MVIVQKDKCQLHVNNVYRYPVLFIILLLMFKTNYIEGRHLTELIVPHLRRGMMQVLYIFRGSLEEEDCAIFTSLGKLEELSYGFAVSFIVI